MTSSLVFTTGHDLKGGSLPDWAKLAISGATVAVYMGRSVAADVATPNADYTEWTIPIRQGLTWSDGEALDANDVLFTFNMIMNTEAMLSTDAEAQKMLEQRLVRMPNQNLNMDDARHVVEFMRTL